MFSQSSLQISSNWTPHSDGDSSDNSSGLDNELVYPDRFEI